MAENKLESKKALGEDLQMNKVEIASMTGKHDRLLKGGRRKSKSWLTDEELNENYNDLYFKYDGSEDKKKMETSKMLDITILKLLEASQVLKKKIQTFPRKQPALQHLLTL